ncbi:hypothetical protein ABMA27_012464 [Loxostege sticticalis]|uniref:Uncharacterized protein n=1 Tax=Loxostege sticticalis TaxID=481309 RepID=A0ABR3H1E2_LOXSC
MDLNLINSDDDLKIDFDIPKPICRCCLTTDRRMNDVVNYDGYFRELAGINVMQSDGLPQWICWECGSLLQKAVRFKFKMLRAHNLLYEYLTRCAPFPIDALDPELSKYTSPQLSETNTLAFEMGGRSKAGFHEELQHEKQNPNDADFNLEALPIDSKVDDLVKAEVDFGVDYDDDITLDEYRPDENKLTDEDIKQLLEDTSTLEPKEEAEVKKKKKTKKKEEKVKKKKKNSAETIEAEEPKTSIRRTIELDPTKIRVITLNPQEQVKQREEESKSGFVFPFQCHLCYKGFNYEAKLDNHMKKHSPSRGTFECKLCHMFLPTAYSFGVHNLIHTRRYECMECGRRMTDRASIVDHYRTQHEGLMNTYKCDICGKVSTNNKTHRGHMRNHHSGDRPKCDQCGKSFVNKDALAEHLLIHQGVKNYECPTCGKRFRTRAQIKHHQLKHTDIKDYYCVECDVRFKSSHSLRQHLQKSLKHKDKQNFKFPCSRCEKRFETEAALRSHTLIQHEGVRGHRCTQCPAALASRSSLLKHIHSVHRGLKPPPRHVCDTCGKAFRGKSVLTNHVRTHTGEKPFACTQCGRGFSQRTAMRTHMKLVHMKIRRRAKVDPEPEPMESKEQVFPKQEWSRPPPPCDLYFHAAA